MRRGFDYKYVAPTAFALRAGDQTSKGLDRSSGNSDPIFSFDFSIAGAGELRLESGQRPAANQSYVFRR